MDRPCRDPNTLSGDPLFYFCSQLKGILLQIKKSKQLYSVMLEFKGGVTRTVTVKAKDRPTAERRALKFHPSAYRVKRDAA